METFLGITNIQFADAKEIPYFLVTLKLFLSLCAGALIGFERSLRGRPVGIRTYCLVCVASTALILGDVHAPIWLTHSHPDFYRADITRVVLAVSEGVAFICLGAIFRGGLKRRGLTTAAALWATAMVGILFGIGFFYTAISMTALIIILLIFFHHVVRVWINSKTYARCNVIFDREGSVKRSTFLDLLAEHKLEAVGNVNLHVINNGKDCEMIMTIRSDVPGAFSRLSKTLRENTEYKTFSINFMQN